MCLWRLEHLHAEDVISRKVFPIQVYGISGSCLKSEIESITGVNPGKNAVFTKETGRVSVIPEIYATAGDPCSGCSGGGGGNGEGALFCVILIIAMFAVFAIVWAVVMAAFAIMTFGGFIRKRYRTLVLIENPNQEFIGKLSVMSVRKGGVLMHPLGHPDYDDWIKDAFSKFMRLKFIRQISIVLGFSWGFIEVAFKLYEIVLNLYLNYNLWPLRYVMVAIFLPLLLYSPILEIQLRNAFEMGEDMVMRIVSREPSFSPDQPMTFEEEPVEVKGIPIAKVRLK
jgi:hypothetical protein